jgi:hypothetical protein
MASALNTKINSYTLNRGIEFDEGVSNTPTRTGTNPLGSFVRSSYPGTILYESSDGPAGGSGSWQFNRFAGQETYLRATFASSSELAGISDNDWSVGFWFKVDQLPTGTSPTEFQLFGILPNASGMLITIVGSSNTVEPSKIRFSSVTNSAVYPDYTVEAGEWTYIAMTVTSTTVKAFVNGQLYLTNTRVNESSATELIFGKSASSSYNSTFNLSNFYLTSTAQISDDEILEIWEVGANIENITKAAVPMTASSTSVDATAKIEQNIAADPSNVTNSVLVPPTIITEIGSNLQVTTSILANAEFPPATASVETFLNIEVQPLEASIELINNIFAGASNSTSIGVQPFLASANIVQPLVAEVPMIASAESGDHTVYVDPNYFNAVTELNPYVYINNGGFASAVNYGSQQGTFTRGSDMDGGRNGGAPLNLVRDGLSWQADGNSLNSDAFMTFTTATAAQHPAQLIGNGTFAFEFWAKPTTIMKSYIYMPGILHLQELPAGAFNTPPARIGIDIKNSPSNLLSLEASNLISFNNWNHFVINFYQSGINENQRLLQVWINGAIKINENIAFTPWTNTNTTDVFIGSNASGLDRISDGFFDEIAWYTAPLTNSQIINHYELISTLSPDHTEFTDPGAANAQSGNHQFTVTSNAIPEIKEATASALILTPTVIAGVSINPNPSAITATAAGVLPQLSLGITASADPMIAYAESANAFHLNSIYSDYVIANVNPYRYVTFDSSTPTEDVGTDNDYSVVPTTVGGVIVNPDEGLNGKSAKTAGTSYVTDGVILKESEWDDTWGTGQANYHSSFWVQKALEDTSTGLRVLWNLNGYLDNQHAILFHYQNKLHLQFNNGSGTHLDAVTANDISIFNGERHFIVIAFDHTNNNNNLVNLYVDSVLVLTVNLGSYTGQTINGTTFVGPNDEANNHPRLSVGCLITPFGVTALPVVPTNTRLIIDEIYWAKTAINQTEVAALYNIMPDKDNNDSAADALHASALMVDPAISTGVNHVSAVATASALINEVTVTADRNIINLALPVTASAELLNAERIDNVNIVADLFVASAIFNDAGVKITFPGGPMLASAIIVKPALVNGQVITNLTAYIRYLRAQNVNGNLIPRLVEIK